MRHPEGDASMSDIVKELEKKFSDTGSTVESQQIDELLDAHLDVISASMVHFNHYLNAHVNVGGG